MYQQARLHKVNMLTQAYLVNMLERAHWQVADEPATLQVSLKSWRTCLLNDAPSPEEYVLLNDAHVKVAAACSWAEHRRCTARRLRSASPVWRASFHKSLRIEQPDRWKMCDDGHAAASAEASCPRRATDASRPV